MAALGVDADGDLAGELAAGLAHQLRITHGDGAENDAGDALGQPAFDMGERADAAAQLHRVFRCAENGFHRRAVDAFSGKGAVEVNHMQIFKALIFKGLGLRRRIVVEHGGLVHVAQLQAHALAVLEVDGGKKDHGNVSLAAPAAL